VAGDRRLIVSNRLPVTIRAGANGLEMVPSSGGLASGLGPWHRRSQGLWFGWPGGREFLLDTAVAGGGLAFLLILARGQLVRPFLPLLGGWAGRLTTPGEPAPYGVAIALGALIAFPTSEWLRFVHTSY